MALFAFKAITSDSLGHNLAILAWIPPSSSIEHVHTAYSCDILLCFPRNRGGAHTTFQPYMRNEHNSSIVSSTPSSQSSHNPARVAPPFNLSVGTFQI
jgi:hypothetical protein